IVPNMFFKIFYRRLEAHINALGKLKDDIAASAREEKNNQEYGLVTARDLYPRLDYIHNGLREQYNEILNHYEQTSLFLETLLRRSHFEQGKYVLERKVCNFKSQIIDPQVERFTPQLREKGIDIALAGVPDQEIEVVVDKGLISQVYANLFSNAVKYTREVTDFSGHKAKFISYGWEYRPDYFGPEKPGIKLNVFSTGPHLDQDEQANLFSEGFRAGNVGKEQGTGHGLFFIKEIVEMHGGEVGYEPTPLGNNFFFTLPLTDPADY
ncbi:HAMP domain-containing sensor histidine kinase, partial [Desulfonatronospira sp.]|uniref:sensor histidine kinase n=1 Tax=Desulfonatronospira sp. TaxID=1962951 RepID=UPI0025B952E7